MRWTTVLTVQSYYWLLHFNRACIERVFFKNFKRASIEGVLDKNPLIEKGHLGDWSPEKDCWCQLTFPETCAEAIFRVNLTLKMATAPVVGAHSYKSGVAIKPTSFPGSFLYFKKGPWLRLVTCLCMPTEAAQWVGSQLNFVNIL